MGAGTHPQQFREELLGNKMAMEAEQALRINESDHGSVELGPQSQASSGILTLKENSEALQGAVLEVQGDTQALQESNSKYELLLKENRQLREQVANLGIQLRIAKDTNQHLRSLQKEQEGELKEMIKLLEIQMLLRSLSIQARNQCLLEQEEEGRGQRKASQGHAQLSENLPRTWSEQPHSPDH